MGETAEKVASSTEIQHALRTENEARLRHGLAPLTESTHVALHDMVLAHIYGLGELEELWHHPAVEEIDANGPLNVWVTFVGGIKKQWAPIASTHEELLELIRRAARRMGFAEVEFDARHPFLDLQLPDGSRLYAVYGGRGTNGVGVDTYLCIRRHRFMEPTPQDLVDLGVWPA
jgi:pilus assembly protein CpaF